MSEFTDSFHQLTAFVIPQLAALLQLKYGANNDPTQSLFSIHPTTMILAISSFMLYYVLHIVLLRSPTPMSRFSAVVQHLVVWSGYAAASALAAALFPAWASTSLYVIFVLLSTGEFIGFFGNKFVMEDEDEDEDEDEEKEGETWKFRVYRRRVRRLCGRVARLFGHQPQPILPIRIQH